VNELYFWIKENTASVINYVANEYWGSNLVIFILFVSCITLLFLNKEKIKRGQNMLAVYSVLLIVFVTLNPFILKPFGTIREAFVLLPMCSIIGCVTAVKSKDMRSKLKTNAVIIVLAVLIVLSGLVIRTDEWIESTNTYKVYDQGLATTQYILEDSNYEPVTVCYMLRTDEYYETDITVYEATRQYSGKIMAFAAVPGDGQSLEGVDYFVMSNEYDASGFDGYEPVFDAGYYTVLSRD